MGIRSCSNHPKERIPAMHEVKGTDEFFENTVAAMQHAVRGKAVAITPGEGEANWRNFRIE